MKSRKISAINNNAATSLLLRLGLALVFLYASISSLQKPDNWTAYLPTLPSAVSPLVAVKLIAIYELVLAVWLLSNTYIKIAAILCVLTFAGILTTNLHQFMTTFRDVGLLFMSLALLTLEK